MDKILKKLPNVIKVKIVKTPSGNYIAELPEYDNVFTQAETKDILEFNINDLIMAYFDVPKKYQNQIWYRPIKKPVSETESIKVPLNFQFFIAKSFSIQWLQHPLSVPANYANVLNN